MNPTIKKKWLKALRSGKYKQGKYRLVRPGETYCCLGVLCEVVKAKRKGDCYIDEHSNTECRAMLPCSVAQKVGIDGNTEGHLATMNDHGDSFLYIADYIEGNVTDEI